MPGGTGIGTLPARPRRVKAITQSIHKNGKADSGKLARLLGPDAVPWSFVASKSRRDPREAARTRAGLRQNALQRRGTGSTPSRPSTRTRYPTADAAGCGTRSWAGLAARRPACPRGPSSWGRGMARISPNGWRARPTMAIPGIGRVAAATTLAGVTGRGRPAGAEKLASRAGSPQRGWKGRAA